MDEQNWYDALISEWDFEKNEKHISEYSKGSHKKVWWMCEEYGHSYENTIRSKSRFGVGCPYCSGREVLIGFNDIATVNNSLSKLISPNSLIKAQEITLHFSKDILWVCDLGHEYEAKISQIQKGRKCPYCSGRKLLSGFNDLKTVHPELSKEVSGKYILKPEEIRFKQRKDVLWFCEKGHEWEASIYERVQGNSCPYCSNRRNLLGYNDLLSLYPTLAETFDEKKNKIKVSEYFPRNTDKLWWLCNDGHSYQTTFESKKKETTCLVCLNRTVISGFNDLQTTHPELSKQWDYDKNKEVSPYNSAAGSIKKVWWLCDLGHSWKSEIRKRAMYKRNCPYCMNQKVLHGFNDLASQRLDIINEWNYEKNDKDPSTIAKRSKIRYWWKCKLGHEWQASPDTRTHGEKCPYCMNKKILVGFNDLETTHPELAKEWSKRNTKEITNFTYGSDYKAWWKCPNEHEWQATISSRSNKSSGNGCRKCSSMKQASRAEKELIDFLQRNLKNKIISSDRTVISPKELDIYIPEKKIAIEYNGLYWHSEAAGKNREYHHEKWNECQKKNIELVSIWEDKWNEDIVVVKNGLLSVLNLSAQNQINISSSIKFTKNDNIKKTTIKIYDSDDKLLLSIDLNKGNKTLSVEDFRIYRNISFSVFSNLLNILKV